MDFPLRSDLLHSLIKSKCVEVPTTPQTITSIKKHATPDLTFSGTLSYPLDSFHSPRFPGKKDVAGGTAWGKRADPEL